MGWTQAEKGVSPARKATHARTAGPLAAEYSGILPVGGAAHGCHDGTAPGGR